MFFGIKIIIFKKDVIIYDTSATQSAAAIFFNWCEVKMKSLSQNANQLSTVLVQLTFCFCLFLVARLPE